MQVPSQYAQRAWTREEALVELVRGRLEGLGPTTAAAEIAESLGVPRSDIDVALLVLEGEGFAMRGSFMPQAAETEWCERRLLARINRYTVKRLRQEIEPVGSADFLRFLFDWQHVTPDERMEGPDAVAAVISQLEGFEAAAAAWEAEILPAHVYRPMSRHGWTTCAWPGACCGPGSKRPSLRPTGSAAPARCAPPRSLC